MLTHSDIRSLLPHRHPILLVDRVLSYAEGERIETIKAISGAEPCYADLPENAPQAAFRYPETLLVESFAQSGALLWLASTRDRGETLDGVGMVAVLSDCVFEMLVYPGDVVRHEVVLERVLGNNVVFSGAIHGAHGRVATIDSVIAAFRPGETLASSENASDTLLDNANAVVAQTLQ
ncbi:3-hydroxyacyl-ACP dehydratase FabZ family protein [Nocardia sp. CA-135953]|uniref:3-hydroxyacyl-ACP dehydratase FabZ family protein n=1 Tax=Nocardia sp. CA-135953 TaxID=3239978 RepID=UPI003D957858